MFSCRYREIFKNSFSYRTPPVVVSQRASVSLIVVNPFHAIIPFLHTPENVKKAEVSLRFWGDTEI